MFRQLGTFAPLALCLFALAIAMGMGDCDDDPQVELTPMEKLAGTYSLVESEVLVDNEVLEPPNYGKLHLRPEGNGWIVTFEYEEGDSSGNSGATWTANATTITFIDSDGDRWIEDYTLEGKFLTLSYFDENNDVAIIEKWRNID